MKYHLLPADQRHLIKTDRTRPRTPISIPKVMIVVGGQAPKAIRSVECYDFQDDRWYQVADLPSRRCRSGVVSMGGRVFAVGGVQQLSAGAHGGRIRRSEGPVDHRGQHAGETQHAGGRRAGRPAVRCGGVQRQHRFVDSRSPQL
ncbi:hypothetical protein CesoFtcFv8_009866 [Champsocephalus esox]|uniref:Uncharacterized protein n=1 Tax=Champsocephalus esox TaxID=159716 RepID=A0AAN8GZY5_9TELE|nr:hypothetical protein CesoFtcFv8_009866 [Champsocephalus esox]